MLRQFRQVFNAVKTHLRSVERKAGVGGAQVWALSVVSEYPGIGVGQLARRMDIRQSTASNLVKALIERNFLTATRDGPDRRAVQLHLMPAGARALRHAPGPFEGVLPSALRSLDEATLRRLHGDLASLLLLLDTDESAARILLADM